MVRVHRKPLFQKQLFLDVFVYRGPFFPWVLVIAPAEIEFSDGTDIYASFLILCRDSVPGILLARILLDLIIVQR